MAGCVSRGFQVSVRTGLFVFLSQMKVEVNIQVSIYKYKDMCVYVGIDKDQWDTVFSQTKKENFHNNEGSHHSINYKYFTDLLTFIDLYYLVTLLTTR